MSATLNTQLNTSEVLWKLTDLYESLDDQQIQDDLDFCHQEADLLQEIQGKLAELEPATFARTVRRLERIQTNLGRIETYAFLNFCTQVKNAEAGAFQQKIKEEGSKISRKLVFFNLEWAKMDQAVAEQLLAHEEVAPYHHFLTNLRRYADHLLSEPEESLLVEFEPVGTESWLNLFEKVLGYLEFGENKRCEEEVLSDLYNNDREIRCTAAQELTEGLQSQIHILTHIFNTILAEKMISDRLRKYPSWIRTRNLSNELEDATVEVRGEVTMRNIPS